METCEKYNCLEWQEVVRLLGTVSGKVREHYIPQRTLSAILNIFLMFVSAGSASYSLPLGCTLDFESPF